MFVLIAIVYTVHHSSQIWDTASLIRSYIPYFYTVIISFTGSWHHEVHPWSPAAVKFTKFLCSMSEERLLDCYKETMEETASKNVKVVSVSCNSNSASNAIVETTSSPSAVTQIQSYVLPVSLAIAVLALISIITAYIVIYYLRQRRKKPQR